MPTPPQRDDTSLDLLPAVEAVELDDIPAEPDPAEVPTNEGALQ